MHTKTVANRIAHYGRMVSYFGLQSKKTKQQNVQTWHYETNMSV